MPTGNEISVVVYDLKTIDGKVQNSAIRCNLSIVLGGKVLATHKGLLYSNDGVLRDCQAKMGRGGVWNPYDTAPEILAAAAKIIEEQRPDLVKLLPPHVDTRKEPVEAGRAKVEV